MANLDKKPHVRNLESDPALWDYEPKADADVPMDDVLSCYVADNTSLSEMQEKYPWLRNEYKRYLTKLGRLDLLGK